MCTFLYAFLHDVNVNWVFFCYQRWQKHWKTLVCVCAGQLAAPWNVSASAITCDTVTLHWEEPYFLPGVPILGYHIILNSTIAQITEPVNKTVDEIQSNGGVDSCDVTVGNCQDPCVLVSVIVAGVNKVGLGTPGSTTFHFLGG